MGRYSHAQGLHSAGSSTRHSERNRKAAFAAIDTAAAAVADEAVVAVAVYGGVVVRSPG